MPRSEDYFVPMMGLQPGEEVTWQGRPDAACCRQSNKVPTCVVFVVLFLVIAFLIWADWRNWWLVPPCAWAFHYVLTDVPDDRYVITNLRVLIYDKNGFVKQAIRWEQVGGIRLCGRHGDAATMVFDHVFGSFAPLIILRWVPQASEVYRRAMGAKHGGKTQMAPTSPPNNLL